MKKICTDSSRHSHISNCSCSKDDNAASDVAYAAVVMFTNAYAPLNPDREEAVVLVKRMQEDLEYFRRHAMPDPHRTRDAAPDDEEPEQPVEPAE